MKEIVILAGPNGAGKTTAARKLLPKFPEIREFLNADEFARRIAPDSVGSAAFAAGRMLLKRMHDRVERVQRRVLAGGHGVPVEDIRRRYYAELANLVRLHTPLADELERYDNSCRRALIASRGEGGILHLWDMKRWRKLRRAARQER